MNDQTIKDVAMIARNAIDKLIELERLNKQPTKVIVIPEILESCGWVRIEKVREEYERGVVNGMQKQMESNVDKAVRAMSEGVKKEWVGLTDEEIDGWKIVGHESLREFVRAIEAKLKEKNT
jgi:hypothetical protein